MKKIKVLFDVSKIADVDPRFGSKCGIFFVTYNILKKFISDERFEVTLYTENNGYLSSIKQDPYVSSFEIIFADYLINRCGNVKPVRNPKFTPKKYDAYINSYNISKLDSNLPKFYILHDVIPLIMPTLFDKEQRLDFFQKYNDVLDENTYCFCVSDDCKKGFLRFFPILDEKKMTVNYIAPQREYTPQKDKNLLQKVLKKYGLSADDKYILTIGSECPRKNIPFAVENFFKFIDKNKIDDLKFYIAGGRTEKIIEYIEHKTPVLAKKHKDKLKHLGYIQDEDLNILYSNCEWFTFLSLYEGFGMPPLEAMASGAPCVVSNVSSIPEICSGYAFEVDPFNSDECIEAYEKFYYDKDLREEYIQKGLKRAKDFSWDKTYKTISDKIIGVIKNNE